MLGLIEECCVETSSVTGFNMDETVIVINKSVAIDQVLQAGLILNFAYPQENRWILTVLQANFRNYFSQVLNFSPILASSPTIHSIRGEIGVQSVISIFGIKEVFKIVESNCMPGIHIGAADSKITKESRNVKKDRKFVA